MLSALDFKHGCRISVLSNWHQAYTQKTLSLSMFTAFLVVCRRLYTHIS